ncbi:hypothetical protein MAP00_002714 [Monascus purpureus]|nr:hypothetical protein MAP00_002714 [Monascus purpureus]
MINACVNQGKEASCVVDNVKCAHQYILAKARECELCDTDPGSHCASPREPISHYIKKIVAIQGALNHLFRFSRSPRMYRVLHKADFGIICLLELLNSSVKSPEPGEQLEKDVLAPKG